MPERLSSSTLDPSRLLEFTYYRGRVALKALLSAIGIRPGDRVVTQAFTCLAVPEGILSVGAKPAYVDIEAGGINMDPRALEKAIVPGVRAIIVQHTFGIPSRLDEIMLIARRHGLPVIEDCCHSFGSMYRGRMLGSFGVGAFYSYEWGKQVVVGLGGSALTSDVNVGSALADGYGSFTAPPRLRVAKIDVQYFAFEHLLTGSTYWFFKKLLRTLSRVGAAEGNFSYDLQQLTPGFEWRMSERLRKRLKQKLRTLPQAMERSRGVADVYRRRLGYKAPTVPEGSDVAYPRYPIFVPDKTALTAFARDRNVEMADWYRTPIHPLEGDALRTVGYEPGQCPNAEKAARTLVSLPVSNKATPASAERLVDTLLTFAG